MIATIRRIRRKLSLISYYSARRERNAWTRALGWALVASLLLPIPLVRVGEIMHERVTTLASRSGGLTGEPGGPLEAVVQDVRDPDLRLRWPEGPPFGEWTLDIVEQRRGWPFPSVREERPARLNLNVFGEATMRIDAQLPADSPIVAALVAALSDPQHRRMLEAWPTPPAKRVHRYWFGTITCLVLWWVALSFVSFASVRLLRIRVRKRRFGKMSLAQRRQAQGRCGTCNYDLRGLEFSDRCPECGSLIT